MVAAALLLTISAILVYLATASAMDADKGAWGVGLVLGVGVLTFAATLVITDWVPPGSAHWADWLQRRPLAAVLVALAGALGAVTAALALIQPRAPTESRPGAIEKAVDDIKAAVTPAKGRPRVQRAIEGLWGEVGCAVVYRMDVRENALVVEAVRRPPGAGAYRLVATIVRSDGDVMHIVGDEPDVARGMAATFTYRTTGATERLMWHDRVRSVPLELERCP
jgi:hypothetical protein